MLNAHAAKKTHILHICAIPDLTHHIIHSVPNANAAMTVQNVLKYKEQNKKEQKKKEQTNKKRMKMDAAFYCF